MHERLPRSSLSPAEHPVVEVDSRYAPQPVQLDGLPRRLQSLKGMERTCVLDGALARPQVRDNLKRSVLGSALLTAPQRSISAQPQAI